MVGHCLGVGLGPVGLVGLVALVVQEVQCLQHDLEALYCLFLTDLEALMVQEVRVVHHGYHEYFYLCQDYLQYQDYPFLVFLCVQNSLEQHGLLLWQDHYDLCHQVCHH